MNKGKDCFIDNNNKVNRLGRTIPVFSAVINLLLFLLIKPFQVSNIANLNARISGDAAHLEGSYQIFRFLHFIKETALGFLGPYIMLLTIAILAVYILSIWFIIRSFTLKARRIPFYELGQYVFVFWFAISLVILVFPNYAHAKYNTSGVFHANLLLCITMLLSILSYVCIKIVEADERRKTKEHGFLKEVRRNWVLFLMLMPAILFFLINSYVPMLGIYFAFEKFNFRDGLWFSPFVGFDNFKFMFKANLLLLTRNTVLYNLVFILLGSVIKIFLAILLSTIGSKLFRRISQTMIFMPYFVSIVILNVLVYNLLNYESGLVNSLVTALGGERINFYSKPVYWPFLITMFYLWKSVGYGTVVYLAAILGISKEYYEAAEVDGANVFQKIWYITLPGIKPMFIIMLLYAIGGIMKGQFELFYQTVGTNGLLFNVTDIFDTYVYRLTIFNPLDNGLGTAAGLYQSIFGFIVIMITNFLVKRKNSEYALF